VLHYHRRFDYFARLQAQAEWRFERARSNSDCRVGIMGMGVLGGAAARALRDLGFSVSGWSRTPKQMPGVESFHGADSLEAFLADTDILCCVLPLTPHTRDILNAETLAYLPRGAKLINIARGAHVVEADLLAALNSGQIGGAMLDVVAQEPLPSDHPLWSHPAVTITPHVAGSTKPATAATQVAENILRARRGEPLLNEVHPDFGY
jgi:glyoxylate/hydroxypyruvate reductase A